MIDIHTPLRTLYYNIMINLGLVCYENGAVPDDAITPYIIISSIDANEDSNKTDFGNSAQVLLDIVTSFEKNKVVGSKLADTIAGQILGLINSKIRFPIFDGLQIVTTKKIQDQKINNESTTHRIYRRLLRFQHLIKEV